MHILARTSDKKIIPVTVDDDGHLQVDIKAITAGDNLIGRVDARDGNKIWSYEDTIGEFLSTNDADAGTFGLDGSVVPAGEIWIVLFGGANSRSRVASQITIEVNGEIISIPVSEMINPAKYQNVLINNPVILSEGQSMVARFYTTTAGDDLRFRYGGYKMSV